MKQLSNIDRISQLFMVGFSGIDADEQLLPLIEQYKLTSFILFKKSVASAEGLRSMISHAKSRARSLGLPPLLFAADEEGGLISPIGDVVGRLPSPMALAAGRSSDRARRAAELVGERIVNLGVDLVLSPVLDVNCEPSNPVIGTRSFGDDPNVVADMGTAVMEGYRSAGLACCAKHFPGHGGTTEDSHKTLPADRSSAAEMSARDLVPFRRAFERKVDAVMTAHVAYPELDAGAVRPSTLSREIQTGLLRGEMGFAGALISDSMEMMGLAESMPPEQACLEALRAGVDLFICVDPDLALRCLSRLESALAEGKLSMEILDRALARVNALKSATGELDKPNDSGRRKDETDIEKTNLLEDTLEECYGESITTFGCDDPFPILSRASSHGGQLLVPDGLPGYGNVDPYLLTISLTLLGVNDRWRVFTYPVDPSDDDVNQIMSLLRPADDVIFCSLSRGPEPPGQVRLARAVAESGKLRLGVALLDPYGLERLFPRELPWAASFGFWPECLRPLMEALSGARPASGVLPVDIRKAR